MAAVPLGVNAFMEWRYPLIAEVAGQTTIELRAVLVLITLVGSGAAVYGTHIINRLRTQTFETEARARAIFNTTPEGVIISDSGGLIRSINPAAEQLFGWTAAEAIGQNVSILMPTPERDQHDGHMQRYLRTGQKRILDTIREVTARRKDGTTFPMELAIGELTRAVLIAGGRVVYGGRIKPSGFTQQLMGEVRRYGTSQHSLTICLALPEHQKLTAAELDQLDRDLGTWGRLILLDLDGSPVEVPRDGAQGETEIEAHDRALAHSSMRRFITEATQARVLVGGQLRGYQGAMPGLVEEAILSIERELPLYLAGGFGGAAALIAQALGLPLDWLPSDAPEGRDDSGVVDSLARLADAASSSRWSVDEDGLAPEQRALLAASHRPADIASLTVLGMARLFNGRKSNDTDPEA